jgi:hypothetical protein
MLVNLPVTIELPLMTKYVRAYLLMGYNPHEHVCELFDWNSCVRDSLYYQ